MTNRTIGTKDFLPNEDASKLDSNQFADLHLMDSEANEIKGGPVCYGVSVLALARVDGESPRSNHNETVSYDEADIEELKDLPPTIEGDDTNSGASPILMQHCASGQH